MQLIYNYILNLKFLHSLNQVTYIFSKKFIQTKLLHLQSLLEFKEA